MRFIRTVFMYCSLLFLRETTYRKYKNETTALQFARKFVAHLLQTVQKRFLRQVL